MADPVARSQFWLVFREQISRGLERIPFEQIASLPVGESSASTSMRSRWSPEQASSRKAARPPGSRSRAA